MKAHILSVGTELLLGDIVNTDAQFIAAELARLGIIVYSQSVVGDNEERLIGAYKEAFDKGVDVIIATGGLGPTKDDLTKECAAKYFGLPMYEDEKALGQIKCFFEKQNLPIAEGNRKQADIPEGAIVLYNENGTAPGVIIEKNGKAIILVPGPPRECIPMIKNQVVPYFEKKQEQTMVSRVLRLCGIGESSAADAVSDLLDNENPTVAPYAKETECHLRITARAKTAKEAEELISPVADEIYKRLGKHIYAENETDLPEAVYNLIKQKGMTVSIAESCTGGMLASRLIGAPGVSEIFKEGIIAYSNESKIKRLGVKEETLKSFGAVSSETACEMAEGAAKTAGTDIGISTTGIAGPDGGTDEKPAGLVFVGLHIKGKTSVRKFQIVGNRERVRARATTNALVFAWETLREM